MTAMAPKVDWLHNKFIPPKSLKRLDFVGVLVLQSLGLPEKNIPAMPSGRPVFAVQPKPFPQLFDSIELLRFLGGWHGLCVEYFVCIK